MCCRVCVIAGGAGVLPLHHAIVLSRRGGRAACLRHHQVRTPLQPLGRVLSRQRGGAGRLRAAPATCRRLADFGGSWARGWGSRAASSGTHHRARARPAHSAAASHRRDTFNHLTSWLDDARQHSNSNMTIMVRHTPAMPTSVAEWVAVLVLT